MAEENLFEEWKAIPPLPYYEASSLGRIRSLDRIRLVKSKKGNQFPRFFRGKTIKLIRSHAGWGQYYLVFEAYGKSYLAHRMICWAFHGEPPTPKHHAAHLDSWQMNCAPSNLKWATQLENESHKRENGTHPRGQNNGFSKLTELEVMQIIKMYSEGHTSIDLGERFNVTRLHICDIIRGKVWSHVQSDYKDAAKLMSSRNAYESQFHG